MATETIHVPTPEQRRANDRYTARVNELTVEINSRLGLPAPVHYTTRSTHISDLGARFSTRRGSIQCVVASIGLDNYLVAPVLTSAYPVTRDDVNAVLADIIDGLNNARLAAPWGQAGEAGEQTDEASAERVALSRALIRINQIDRVLAPGEIRVTTTRSEIIVDLDSGRVVAETPACTDRSTQEFYLELALPALRRVAELIDTIHGGEA